MLHLPTVTTHEEYRKTDYFRENFSHVRWSYRKYSNIVHLKYYIQDFTQAKCEKYLANKSLKAYTFN